MKRDPKKYQHLKGSQCVACGCFSTQYNPLDPDHVKTLKSGGENEAFNIMTLCRTHHVEKGQKGISHMAEKYYSYKKWLLSNGWEFDEFRAKWVRYGKVD